MIYPNTAERRWIHGRAANVAPSQWQCNASHARSQTCSQKHFACNQHQFSSSFEKGLNMLREYLNWTEDNGTIGTSRSCVKTIATSLSWVLHTYIVHSIDLQTRTSFIQKIGLGKWSGWDSGQCETFKPSLKADKKLETMQWVETLNYQIVQERSTSWSSFVGSNEYGWQFNVQFILVHVSAM